MPTANQNQATKPKVQIGDEVREMTDEEFAQYELDQEKNAQLEIERLARAEAKASLLDRLGITAEEAKLLLG